MKGLGLHWRTGWPPHKGPNRDMGGFVLQADTHIHALEKILRIPDVNAVFNPFSWSPYFFRCGPPRLDSQESQEFPERFLPYSCMETPDTMTALPCMCTGSDPSQCLSLSICHLCLLSYPSTMMCQKPVSCCVGYCNNIQRIAKSLIWRDSDSIKGNSDVPVRINVNKYLIMRGTKYIFLETY